ncbi:MAG: hypothetical protein WC919_07675 [Candidatus Paceibacterota bacterium]|jgi:hypothetical protein
MDINDKTDPAPVADVIPTACSQCGKDAANCMVVLLDGQFYRVHPGLCTAQFYLAHPTLMERNGLTPEYLEEYVARQQ